MTLDPKPTHPQGRGSLAAFVVCATLLVSMVMPLGISPCIGHAQTYTPGLATVGSPTPSNAVPSKMLIDATQFIAGTDMCGAIKAACGQLTNVVGAAYPAGATIDARGFTGNQVCAATNITTMLFKCVTPGSSTGATGGKLLLGEVNLYADGPSSLGTIRTAPPGSGRRR